MISSKKVLVTGAAGQLGRQLVKQLQEKDSWEVIPCDRSCLDITNRKEVEESISTVHDGWVVNCAGMTNVDACETDNSANTVNAQAVNNLAEACEKHGAKLLQISTDYVFDGDSDRPYREDDPPNPLNAYARSKLLAEQYARNCPHHLIVRTAWLFSRGSRNFVETILSKAQAGQPLQVVNDQVGSPSYVPDIAAGIELLMNRNSTGLYHLVNAGSASWYELACEVVSKSGFDVPVTPINSQECSSTVHRPAYSRLDCSRYTAATGQEPRPWIKGLDDFFRS